MSTRSPDERAGGAGHGLVKSPLDFAGGIFLIALAAARLRRRLQFAVRHPFRHRLRPDAESRGHPGWRVRRSPALAKPGVGRRPPGALALARSGVRPRCRSRLCGVHQGLDPVIGRLRRPSALASLKVPPLGLIVAGPLAVMFSSLADKDTRPVEVVIFAVVMTLLCGLLFKELLQLADPVRSRRPHSGAGHPRLRRCQIRPRAGLRQHQKSDRSLRGRRRERFH